MGEEGRVGGMGGIRLEVDVMWAAFDPLGPEGLQVGRLKFNHLFLSPLIIISVSIWSFVPFSCTYVTIVSLLVIRKSIFHSYMYDTTFQKALFHASSFILKLISNPVMAKGSKWALYRLPHSKHLLDFYLTISNQILDRK